MSRDPQTCLDYEARRRPVLAEALARLDQLDAAAIAALPVLPWMRQALLARQRHRTHAAAWAATEAALRGHVVTGHTPDPEGVILRWQGADHFLALDRGAVEVRTGRLLWRPDTGGVWFEHIFSHRVDPSLARHTHPVMRARRSVYVAQYRAEIARSTALAAPDMTPRLTASAGSVSLTAYGVRFSRPAGAP